MSTGPGRRLVLLRHGRTAWNAIGRAQGHADVGLDDRGHEQAAEAAEALALVEPVRLWTSDLTRAQETCTYVEKATGLVATVDPRLREYDVGRRQGMTLAQFAEAFPEEHSSWTAGDDLVAVPGAETGEEVAARLVPALREALSALAPGETGVVVSHGAALKIGLVGLLGWPPHQTAALRGMDNAGWAVVAELEADGPLRLAAYNVVAPARLAAERGPADR